MILGALLLAAFAGVLLWDFLGQPTKIRHLTRRRGSIGRSRKRPSGTADKTPDIDDAA